MGNDGRPTELMGYEAMQQEALRGVVRAALKRAATHGLPGDHHFFITFRTRAPGVSGPTDLLGKYPDEMMIVLQHQFWDLAPGETFFSVTLQFNRQPKPLSIPYAAITQFWDPVAEYRLQFNVPEVPAEPEALPAPEVVTPQAESAPAPKIVSLDQFRKK
jgi:hypothetical protein